jgi:hypothetical protein
MVEAIVPVVHGSSRLRYALSVVLHVLGATLSAAAVGALLGAIGAFGAAPWGSVGPIAVGTVALLYAAREGFGVPIPIPDAHRQVPDWWRSFYSPPVASFLYGLGLGPGYFTFLTFGTYVAVSVGALVSGNPLVAAAVCAPFGLARGLSVLVSAGAHSGEEAGRVIDRLESLADSPLPRVANSGALVGVAGIALLGL